MVIFLILIISSFWRRIYHLQIDYAMHIYLTNFFFLKLSSNLCPKINFETSISKKWKRIFTNLINFRRSNIIFWNYIRTYLWTVSSSFYRDFNSHCLFLSLWTRSKCFANERTVSTLSKITKRSSFKNYREFHEDSKHQYCKLFVMKIWTEPILLLFVIEFWLYLMR